MPVPWTVEDWRLASATEDPAAGRTLLEFAGPVAAGREARWRVLVPSWAWRGEPVPAVERIVREVRARLLRENRA